MKKRYVQLLSAVLSFIVLASLCACSKSYDDSFTTSELAAQIEAAVPVTNGYVDAEDDFVDFNMPGASELCTDHSVKLSYSDVDMNEFGVFRTKSEADAKKVAELCQKYLDKANSGMIGDYNPTELPKIEDAKVVIYGKYVIYTVLTSKDHNAANSAILEKIEK